jgi:hypothetical protein
MPRIVRTTLVLALEAVIAMTIMLLAVFLTASGK